MEEKRSILESVVELKSFNNIYKDKTVLITGHTGFKGSWLAIWLHLLGAKVVGYALDPYTDKDNFVLSKINEKIIDIRGDIRDTSKLNEVFSKYKPEFVFHLAAQPLVRLSYDIPVETYEVNLMGSINVLEAVRKCESTKVAVMVTTDKCYENKEQIWGYKETDHLGGYDPYSSSKGAAEIAINSWRLSFFNPKDYQNHKTAVASVRAGNVIGGGDWALNRIVPDCIIAIENNQQIEIRSPKSTRPWEFVLEPLSGYLLLGAKMYEDPTNFCEAWNFGPNQDSITPVWDVASGIVSNYGKGSLLDASDSTAKHEAALLSLDITKAKYYLGWTPTLDIDETIKMTVDWYKSYTNTNVYDLCIKQITDFSIKGGYL